MLVGFTGTRTGMTLQQKGILRLTLSKLFEPGQLNVFHHGDCKGSDAEAHDIAEELGYTIWIHPPKNPSLRARKNPTRGVILDERDYLDRNHRIVECCRVLLATPSSKKEKFAGSGTWATVRYAHKLERDMIIIFPDGSEDKHCKESLNV